MLTTTRVALNTVTGWGARAMDAAVAIALVPFLLYQLGLDGYGLAALMGVLVSFTMMADFGLREALSRQLAERVAVDDKRGANELVSSSLLIYVSIGSVLALACVLCSPLLARLFNVPASIEPQAVQLIRWYGGGIIWLSFIEPIYSATIISTNRFDLLNIVQIGASLLRGLGLFAVLGLTDAGLAGWAIVSLVSILVRLFAMRQVALSLWPTLRIRPGLARRAGFRSLLSLGGYLYVAQFTRIFVQNAHPLVLSAFLGPSAVAVYHPGARLVAMCRPFIQALSNQLHPLATKFFVTADHHRIRELLVRGTRFAFLLGIPVGVLFAVFAEPIAHLWLAGSLGDAYRVTAAVILIWALIDLSVYAEGTQWPVLLGMKRIGFVVFLDLPFALLAVSGAIVLVGYSPLGVLGVVIPTLVTEMIRRIILAAYTARVCGVRIAAYATESYLRPFIVLAVLLAAALLTKVLIAPRALPDVVACVLGIALLWCPLCWWVGLTVQDRQILRGLLGRLLPGFRDQIVSRRDESAAAPAEPPPPGTRGVSAGQPR